MKVKFEDLALEPENPIRSTAGRRYRVLSCVGCGKARKHCPDRRKHEGHCWIDGENLEQYHCVGVPTPKPRCEENNYTNYQCLLHKGHKGDHRRPCTDQGKHGSHPLGGQDAKGNPYWCSGRMFDLT